MQKSKSYTTWANRIMGGRVTAAQATQFGHAIHTVSIGAMQKGKACNITVDEADELVALLRGRNPIVDERDAQRGREWLKANARKFGLPTVDYDAIDHFRWVDTYIHAENDTRWGYIVECGPTYRAYWRDGSWLEYSPRPWQRGVPQSKGYMLPWRSSIPALVA